MSETIAAQINALRRMKVLELRRKYREVFGEDTRSGNKDWLWKRIAWRIQEMEYGGLSDRAKHRAAQLANEADIRTKVPKDIFAERLKTIDSSLRCGASGAIPRDGRVPPSGTVIERIYKGKTYSVMVVDGGFEYEGRKYKSLSAIAREITGTHWNGYHFFNL